MFHLFTRVHAVVRCKLCEQTWSSWLQIFAHISTWRSHTWTKSLEFHKNQCKWTTHFCKMRHKCHNVVLFYSTLLPLVPVSSSLSHPQPLALSFSYIHQMPSDFSTCPCLTCLSVCTSVSPSICNRPISTHYRPDCQWCVCPFLPAFPWMQNMLFAHEIVYIDDNSFRGLLRCCRKIPQMSLIFLFVLAFYGFTRTMVNCSSDPCRVNSDS